MRRSGSLARSVLVRTALGRRRQDNLVVPDSLAGFDTHVGRIAPISPAVSSLAGPPLAGPIAIPLLPGARTLDRRIKFGIVNACTLASLALGMVAIFLSMHGEVKWAAVCILACVSFDGLDGALARRFGVASPFGAQMDSMADMASFGIATPVMVFAWLQSSAPLWLLVPACALIAGCAAIRLARFNVSPKDGRFFCGVPTTMTAAILALSALFVGNPVGILAAAVAVLALLMVSTFPYAKLARILRLPPWLLVIPIGGALVVKPEVTFLALVAVYLISGPLLWSRHKNS